MDNPWSDLPDSAPFVATVDAEMMAAHPRHASGLRLDFLPSPFVGSPDTARVLLLMLNPGARNNDADYGPAFVKERRRAMRFESELPFWTLNPDFAHMEGYAYARSRMAALIDAVGQTQVARRMMWLQYFGYQSLDWRPFPGSLPSQAFSFDLLRSAIAANKTVIVGRSRKLWEAAVPELADCNPIELRNPRSPYLTPRNMGADAFQRVIDALRE